MGPTLLLLPEDMQYAGQRHCRSEPEGAAPTAVDDVNLLLPEHCMPMRFRLDRRRLPCDASMMRLQMLMALMAVCIDASACGVDGYIPRLSLSLSCP
ncbi:hypothetical protein QA646_28965 (plasmid) [Rhizobium sp. CB3090]|uniref:hypothetical protein n=1 Tax=Rhizobium sp. CB3090 TaxID=3039156 RepID=UPI0024B15EB9|nr:hypothetical protein [Rhizobium sp. CB3090]WFU12918.1 hypothetical protein QA646_28965 [Rhizobium sp. CB3090]